MGSKTLEKHRRREERGSHGGWKCVRVKDMISAQEKLVS